MEDPLYVSHQLEQFSQHALSPLGAAFANDVRYLTWTKDRGANPVFVKCADLLDALQAEQALFLRDSKDTLATPVANLVALDCKAVADLKKHLSKAQSKEEGALERVHDLRKRQLFQDPQRLAKAEGEYEEARKMRVAVQDSYEARSRALVVAWKHDLSIAVLSHLGMLRDYFRRVTNLLERESEWMERTIALEEETRKAEFDALAGRYANQTSRVFSMKIDATKIESTSREHSSDGPALTTKVAPKAATNISSPPSKDRNSISMTQLPKPLTQSSSEGSSSISSKAEGILWMFSSKSSRWARRWVVVDDCRVAIYKAWRDGWPHKVLILTPWSKASVSDDVVSIETDGEILDHITTQFKAQNAAEARNWHRLLSAMIEGAIGKDTLTMARRSVAVRTSSPASQSSITAFASGTQFPSSLEASQTLLEGSACSECGLREGGSTWCCVQYGITMCEKCADAFGAVGFRSVLRTKDIDIISMQLILGTGNVLAQVLWEGRKTTAQASRPSPTSDQGTREAWIHTKYADRAFVTPQSTSAPITVQSVLSKSETFSSVHWLAAAILSEIAHGTWDPSALIDGMPLLHALVSHTPPLPKLDVILLLAILNGCEIDGRVRGTRDTPLHVACARDCVEAARLLLLQGADETLFNAKGDIPKALATRRCAALFEEVEDDGDSVVSLSLPLHESGKKPLPPEPARESASAAASNRDEWGGLDQFLNSHTASSTLPELPGGGLTLASYENADLSVLSPRTGRKRDPIEEKTKRNGNVPDASESSDGKTTKRSPRDEDGQPLAGLERDQQQRALVEAAKREQSKKKRNARFIKLKDNIKFAVKNPPPPASPRSEDTQAHDGGAKHPKFLLKTSSIVESSGSSGDPTWKGKGSGKTPREHDSSGVSSSPISPRKKELLGPRPGSLRSPRRGSRLSISATELTHAASVVRRTVTPIKVVPVVLGFSVPFERKLLHARVVPPPAAATVSRTFEDRLKALVALFERGVVNDEEFYSRLIQLARKAPNTIKEDGVERRLAMLIELWTRDLITEKELRDRMWKLIKSPPPQQGTANKVSQ